MLNRATEVQRRGDDLDEWFSALSDGEREQLGKELKEVFEVVFDSISEFHEAMRDAIADAISALQLFLAENACERTERTREDGTD